MTARSKVQASAFKERCSAECRASQSSHPRPCLKDEMTLKVGALYPYTMNPYMVYEP